MLELINKALGPVFFELVEKTTESIRLCAPLIKEEIMKRVFENKQDRVRIDVVTDLNVENFQLGLSDISALEMVQEKQGTIFFNSRLNAKLYIFDSKYSIVTSANLSPTAFENIFEYGIVFDNKDLVKQTVKDFYSFCSSDNAGLVTSEDITSLKKILNTFHTANDDNYDSKKDTTIPCNILKDMEGIYETLSNWQKITVDVINTIGKEEFQLSDVYLFEDYFKNEYPNNNTICSTIRRTLQELRDLGLLEFTSRGNYKKLWKSWSRPLFFPKNL